MIKTYNRPEIWAGIECTINRLHTGYKDQLDFSKHYEREDDIDAIAGLGIKTLRYPVLWEKHQPVKHSEPDFTWAAKNLNRLKELNVQPIIGLVHHGSGPEYTNLLDPDFPYLLAEYAAKVARQFPWVEMYTPVNEPLTTARFSGLYGFWYPHLRSEETYIKMLLNQLKGVVLSMREIRKINPSALLVQTEDMAKTYSTPLLQYQANMENHRRFYTHDILCGRFNEQHPSWEYFMRLGIDKGELQFFIDNPCPPDILGVNYYCTSERYLDEEMQKYPPSRHGGNYFHNYADVEAIRVKINEPHGFEFRTKELWERYNIPIAITEAHLHCTREEQMKWFMDIYNSACKLAQEGVDIKAVTSWSILGSYGWKHLLMSDDMEYERGAFDVSSGMRRPTALAKMLKAITEAGSYNCHSIHGVGWWKKGTRFFDTQQHYQNIEFTDTNRPIIITGKTGTLGRAFSKLCNIRSLPHVLLGRDEMNICNPQSVKAVIKKYNPWAIVNTAGYVRVDDAENDREKCFRENTLGPEVLASACKKHDIKFATFSSDLVFDGAKAKPYKENDIVNPLNTYGKSKAQAEAAVSTINPDSLIIRTSAFFGPWDEYNFVHAVVRTLAEGNPFYASNEIISPTYVPHLVNATLDLLIDDESGIWHLSNDEAVTWYEFAKIAAERAGLDITLVKEHAPELPAPRPPYTVLSSNKGKLMPSLATALNEYFSEVVVIAEYEEPYN
jgi:dTDP-4-dehydrorhamnose reductase